MARKRKSSASKAAYQKEYKRIKQIFYRAQKAGKPLDPELMPKKPSELSSKQYASATKKLKKITPSVLREKSKGYTPERVPEDLPEYESDIPPMDNQASLQILEEIGNYIEYLRPDPASTAWQRQQQETRIPFIQQAWNDLMLSPSTDLTALAYQLSGKAEEITQTVHDAVFASKQESFNVNFSHFMELIHGKVADAEILAYYSDYGA